MASDDFYCNWNGSETAGLFKDSARLRSQTITNSKWSQGVCLTLEGVSVIAIRIKTVGKQREKDI